MRPSEIARSPPRGADWQRQRVTGELGDREIDDVTAPAIALA